MMRALSIGVDFSASCQHCLGELDHDGDNYTCANCRVYFSESTTEAYYLDDDAAPCAQPYPYPTPVHDHYVDRHGTDRAYVRHDFPCALPSGHTSEHYHPHHFIHCRTT